MYVYMLYGSHTLGILLTECVFKSTFFQIVGTDLTVVVYFNIGLSDPQWIITLVSFFVGVKFDECHNKCHGEDRTI